MAHEKIILIIVLMTLVTIPSRMLPIWLLAGKELPEKIKSWLSFVPGAVIGALLFPAIFLQGEVWISPLHNQFLWATLPTAVVAYRTKNLPISLAVGVVTLAIIRLF
jgi:branched-subunit amino acid transport protein